MIMKGLSFTEFYEKLFYGADIDFAYDSLYYHITSGCDESNKHGITVYEYDKHPDQEPSYYNEIFNISNTDVKKNIDAFLKSNIFGDKSISEIESEMEILFS